MSHVDMDDCIQTFERPTKFELSITAQLKRLRIPLNRLARTFDGIEINTVFIYST